MQVNSLNDATGKSRCKQQSHPKLVTSVVNGPFSEEYLQAACVEVETSEATYAWEVVNRNSEINVLPSTWAFKCKQFPMSQWYNGYQFA